MCFTSSVIGDLLVLVILAIVGFHCLSLHFRRKWIVLDPLNTFWAGILICYVLQPITGADIFMSWHREGIYERTLFAVVFGLLFVIAGYEMRCGVVLAGKIPRPPTELSPSKLLPTGLALMALGLCGYAYIIHLSGGLAYWLSIGRGGTDQTRVQGYLPELAQALPAGVMLLLFRASLFRVSGLSKIVAWLVGGMMWLWFLYLGSRSRLITFTIVMVAAYYLPAKKNPKIWVAAVLFAFLYIAVAFQDYRENFSNLSFHLEDIDARQFLGKILPETFGGSSEVKQEKISLGSEFNCTMAVIELVPKKVSYNCGYGFLEVFTRPIPRAIWPDKPHPHMESVQGVLREAHLSDAVVENAQNKEPLLMGPAFCFIGHWYYAGGFIGLAVGGILTGILLKTIGAYYRFNRDNLGVMVIYPLLIGAGFFEAAGTPLYWLSFNLPIILLLFLIVLYLCKVNRPASASRCPRSRTAPQALRSVRSSMPGEVQTGEVGAPMCRGSRTRVG